MWSTALIAMIATLYIHRPRREGVNILHKVKEALQSTLIPAGPQQRSDPNSTTTLMEELTAQGFFAAPLSVGDALTFSRQIYESPQLIVDQTIANLQTTPLQAAIYQQRCTLPGFVDDAQALVPLPQFAADPASCTLSATGGRDPLSAEAVSALLWLLLLLHPPAGHSELRTAITCMVASHQPFFVATPSRFLTFLTVLYLLHCSALSERLRSGAVLNALLSLFLSDTPPSTAADPSEHVAAFRLAAELSHALQHVCDQLHAMAEVLGLALPHPDHTLFRARLLFNFLTTESLPRYFLTDAIIALPCPPATSAPVFPGYFVPVQPNLAEAQFLESLWPSQPASCPWRRSAPPAPALTPHRDGPFEPLRSDLDTSRTLRRFGSGAASQPTGFPDR